MKTYVLALSFATASLQATAGCVALDYQEMKDMKPDELLDAWCEVRLAVNKNMTESIAALGDRNPDSEGVARQNAFDQCFGQAKRIERILETKGIAKKDLLGICVAKGK